jgi:hypothetical protein
MDIVSSNPLYFRNLEICYSNANKIKLKQFANGKNILSIVQPVVVP